MPMKQGLLSSAGKDTWLSRHWTGGQRCPHPDGRTCENVTFHCKGTSWWGGDPGLGGVMCSQEPCRAEMSWGQRTVARGGNQRGSGV